MPATSRGEGSSQQDAHLVSRDFASESGERSGPGLPLTRTITFEDEENGKRNNKASRAGKPHSRHVPSTSQLRRRRGSGRGTQRKLSQATCCRHCAQHGDVHNTKRHSPLETINSHDADDDTPGISDADLGGDDDDEVDALDDDENIDDDDEHDDDCSDDSNEDDDEEGTSEADSSSKSSDKLQNRRLLDILDKDYEKQDETLSSIVYRRLPVFTGVIAPFSIMLEIPGLTAKWYVRLDADHMVKSYRDNPAILDVGLAFSFASAIIANLAILGRFIERIAPRKATLIAMLALLTHDTINIIALISFGIIHNVDDGFTYSEAYWMTTASTGASLLCTSTLLIDFWRTANFRNAGSGLTKKQSQLVVVVMAFLTYISISALIFALSMPLPFLDAMYFMVETQATVGLGDIVPNSTGTRIAFFFVTPGGIMLLAIVVAFARLTILEELENAYKSRRERLRRHLAENEEKRIEFQTMRRSLRSRLKRSMSFSTNPDGSGAITRFKSSDGASISDRLKRTLSRSSSTQVPASPQSPEDASSVVDNESRQELDTNAESSPPEDSSGSPADPEKQASSMSGSDGKGDVVDQYSLKQAQDDVSKSSPRSDSPDNDEAFVQALRLYQTLSSVSTGEAATQLQQLEAVLSAQKRGFNDSLEQLGRELAREQRTEFVIKLGGSFLLFVVFWTVGALIFSKIEGWSYFDGIYFVFVVFTSIGFGDFAPKKSTGRAFFIVWALFGFSCLTILFSIISDSWSNALQQRKLASGKIKKRRRRKAIRRLRSIVSVPGRRSRRVSAMAATPGDEKLDNGTTEQQDIVAQKEPTVAGLPNEETTDAHTPLPADTSSGKFLRPIIKRPQRSSTR